MICLSVIFLLAGFDLLMIAWYNLENYGGRAFSVVAPKLWNNLPLDIKLSPTANVFKSRLKTYLFKNSYYRLVFFLDLLLSIFLIVYCFNFDFYCCKAPLDIG